MASEGLAALAASDEDLDSRTPVARLVPAAEAGYKEGMGGESWRENLNEQILNKN